jgi:hypothetical protein
VQPTEDHDVDRALGGAGDRRAIAALARALSASARTAGAGAVASGRWVADWLVDNVPRIPVRDLATLEAHHGGRRGAELAAELVGTASRASAAFGAAAGVLVAGEELAPPAWLAIPMELIVETVAVAAIELKLVAELHEAYGRPVTGSRADRSLVLLQAWADRRGVTPATLGHPGGVADALGRGARDQVVRLVRRRLVRRLGRNLSALAPLLAGAVAGAELNRRATRALGEAVMADLARL